MYNTKNIIEKQDENGISIIKKGLKPLKFLRTKFGKISAGISVGILSAFTMAIPAFADTVANASSLDTTEGEDAFGDLIAFFATWIGRIGMVVAFIGGIMFALAIKNEDAEQKTKGIMTMAAGFVVFALTQALGLFGL
jgi:hypothetical protein